LLHQTPLHFILELAIFSIIYAIIVIAFLGMVIYSSRGLPLAQMLWNQIGRRIKISGAQWNRHNVAQVLKHRCAYLNGYVYSLKYI
jgi:hypothetical protein